MTASAIRAISVSLTRSRAKRWEARASACCSGGREATHVYSSIPRIS